MSKRPRVIDQLRKDLPGKWVYKGPAHWERSDGLEVVACAITGGYSGDELVGVRYWAYPKEGNPFAVLHGRMFRGFSFR